MKNFTRLDHTVNDKEFIFFCSIDADIRDVRDSLHKFLGVVDVVEKTAMENRKAAEEKSSEKTDLVGDVCQV